MGAYFTNKTIYIYIFFNYLIQIWNSLSAQAEHDWLLLLVSTVLSVYSARHPGQRRTEFTSASFGIIPVIVAFVTVSCSLGTWSCKSPTSGLHTCASSPTMPLRHSCNCVRRHWPISASPAVGILYRRHICFIVSIPAIPRVTTGKTCGVGRTAAPYSARIINPSSRLCQPAADFILM